MRTQGLNSKQNVRKNRWRWRLIGVLLLMVVLGLSVFIFMQYSFFPVREVIFYGNRHLSEAEMKGLMGFKDYEDLLHLSLRRLSWRLSLSPWIKAVSLRKEYPSRLLVGVKEAEPLAIVNSSGLFIIDEEGKKLEELKGEPMTLLPVISTQGGMKPDAFSEALRLAKAIKDSGISGRQVEILTLDQSKESLSARIDGVVVMLGEGGHAEKLKRFLEIEEEIKKRWSDIEHVDLRFANRVVVRPLKEVLK